VYVCVCVSMRAGAALASHAHLSRVPLCVPQEKADHLGIVATIVGTPITALMVRRPRGLFIRRWACCGGCGAAASLLVPSSCAPRRRRAAPPTAAVSGGWSGGPSPPALPTLSPA
jgi:predicted membrane channel-forming protein YqfA (hemolysin III family)